jgi:hypothetical protein
VWRDEAEGVHLVVVEAMRAAASHEALSPDLAPELLALPERRSGDLIRGQLRRAARPRASRDLVASPSVVGRAFEFGPDASRVSGAGVEEVAARRRVEGD